MSQSKNQFTDLVQRFIFDNYDVRGCYASLDKTCQAIQTNHAYPSAIAKLLNEFSVAATLVRDSLKLNGGINIQFRSHGKISLLMADCMANNDVRAVAEYEKDWKASNDNLDLRSLGNAANGILAITVTPDDGERYQGIVPIESATLAGCLQDYFQRSEQLPSSFKFFANESRAMGIALHALPVQLESDSETAQRSFEHVNCLKDSLTQEEALVLSSTNILRRLYHNDACRVFEPKSVSFGCQCSEERSLDALMALGAGELKTLIAERKRQGHDSLRVECHFCSKTYIFPFESLNLSIN